MSSTAACGAGNERALWLDGPDGAVHGIVTTPPNPSGQAVLLCPGGWFGTATNRNRLLVRLARRLAATGATVLRLEWHGIGESAGKIDRYELDKPFVADVLAGLDHLQGLDVAAVDVIGVCFGAHTALAAAAEHPDRLRSLMLVSMPVVTAPGGARPNQVTTNELVRLATKRSALSSMADPTVRRLYGRRLRQRLRHRREVRSGAPPQRARGKSVDPRDLPRRLRAVAAAGVPTAVLFGEDDAYYQNFKKLLDGRLGDLAEPAGGLLRVETAAGDLSGFGSVAAQELAIEHAAAWVASQSSRPVRRTGAASEASPAN